MSGPGLLLGVPLEEAALSVDELARACAVERHWIVERVEAGLLHGATVTTTIAVSEWRFASPALRRAKRLRAIERDFEANAEMAAFAVDLIEELDRLRARLGKAAGSRIEG